MSLLHERMRICYPPRGRPCPQVGPAMTCKLLGRVGVDYLRDPAASCPLERWGAVTAEAPARPRVAAGDGGEALPGKASQGCGGCAKTGLAKIAHGAAGLAKAAIGLERASDEAIGDRTRLCHACDKYRHGFCGQCGCLIAAKVRVGSEACPVGKWSAVLEQA